MTPSTSLHELPMVPIDISQPRERWTEDLLSPNIDQCDINKEKRVPGQPSRTHTKQILPITPHRPTGARKAVNMKGSSKAQIIGTSEQPVEPEPCFLSPAVTEDYDGDNSQAESDDEEGVGWGTKPGPQRLRPSTPLDAPIQHPSVMRTLIAREQTIKDLCKEIEKVARNRQERRIEMRNDGSWRTVVQEPCWPEGPSAPSVTFLYDDMRDNSREMRVNSSLLRAAMCLRRGDIDRADTYISEALPLAVILNYPPLLARCCFWKFLVRRAEGRHESAARALLVATACVGKYIEGEEVEEYLVEYRHTIDKLRLDFDDEFVKEVTDGRDKARAMGITEF